MRCIFASALVVVASAARADPTTAATIDAGYLSSQITGLPMLVLVDDGSTDAGRRIAAVHVDGFVNVTLRLDPTSPVARSLGVRAMPAARVIGPNGETRAAADGLSGPAAFEVFVKAVPATPAGRPTSTADLVDRLGSADVSTRGSAIRSLRRKTDAAAAVIEAVGSPSATRRMSAAELLSDWGAPLAGFDPWSAKSLTDPMRRDLAVWATSFKGPTTRPTVSIDEDLAAMSVAVTDVGARAIRERIVAMGPGALPQVVEAIRKSPPEPARHRLVATRYRLAATDDLAEQWPGGFDRLAAAEPRVRRQAVADLNRQVTPSDAGLLSELFADDDPYVRSQALLKLRDVGGAATNQTLIKMLADPQVNVRAAVLDTFADKPEPELVPELLKYAAGEPDADLVVHVVHVLEATPGQAAFDGLLSLLEHKQWRVRGEAAESMLAKLTGYGPNTLSADQKQSAVVALVKRLDDPDGYVVNRAAGTLLKAEFKASAKALLRRSVDRPDLAREVLRAVRRNSDEAVGLIPYLQPLLVSKTEDVRGEALAVMAEVDPAGAVRYLSEGLSDPSAVVRSSSLSQMVAMVKLPISWNLSRHVWSEDNTGRWWTSTERPFSADSPKPAVPQWLGKVAPKLPSFLGEPATRLQAAVLLCCCGQSAAGLPVLLKAERGQTDDAAAALPWLDTAGRRSLLVHLVRTAGIGKSDGPLDRLVMLTDPADADALWEILGDGATDSDFGPLVRGLELLYPQPSTNEERPTARPADVATIARHLGDKSERARLAALVLLAEYEPTEAVAAADQILAAPTVSAAVKSDAFSIALTARPAAEASAFAVSRIDDPALSSAAFGYLCLSPVPPAVRSYVLSSTVPTAVIGSGPIRVEIPTGMDTEDTRRKLKAMVGGPDADRAAMAGYLLALTKDQAGYDALYARWKSGNRAEPWTRLIYRSIAATNDDGKTPVLVEIYQAKLAAGTIPSELYWTIRSMTGARVLALRQTIRDKVGMDSLRRGDGPAPQMPSGVQME